MLKGLTNAWLSPKGRIVIRHEHFYAEGAWHEELALCILADIWLLDHPDDAYEKKRELHGHEYAYVVLENMGWIRLHGYGGMEPIWIVPPNKKLTHRQEETIIDWCIANNERYDQVIEYC